MGTMHWRILGADSSSGGGGLTSNGGFLLVSRALFSLLELEHQPWVQAVHSHTMFFSLQLWRFEAKVFSFGQAGWMVSSKLK